MGIEHFDQFCEVGQRSRTSANEETPDAWRRQISEDLLRTLKKG